jgi:glycosyltransferase involved in cell wall biosynthesis
MPLVTVLLPVHNGERFLTDAINSILNQTFRDFELLIIDDCSTDKSISIIESFNDSRIRLIRSDKRLKLAGVLNLGLDSSKGDLVARMDSDDISFLCRLEIQVKFMKVHKDIGICGAWVKAFGDHSSSGAVFKYPSGSDDIKASLFFDNPFAHPTVIFRKKLFDAYGLRFDGSYNPAEDYELWIRALEYFPARNLPEVLLNYRLHADSMTMSGKPEMDAQSIRLLRSEFVKLGLNPSNEELMHHRLISTNRVTLDNGMESLKRAEKWLVRLIDANKNTQRSNDAAFTRAVGGVWFSVAYRHLNLGWQCVQEYMRSPLCRWSSECMKNRLIMLMAMVKRSYSGKPCR